MRDLINNVIQWAEERGLMDNAGAERQALKAGSELGEFYDEILKGNKERQILELGDVIVTLILTGKMLDIDLEEALAAAYEKISKRKGSTVNGIFIKEADL